MFRFTSFASIAILAATAVAQTHTDCNPLNTTCPADPALGTTYNKTFTASDTELDTDLWNVTAGSNLISFGDDGAEFTLSQKGDSITAQSTFYVMWGTLEVMMKAANGTGIISTVVLLSDDLDEIDLEVKGGNTTSVATNYYGWGNTSQYNSIYPDVDGPQESMHNYTIVWDSTQLQWIIDGSVARTVPYAEAGQYPQSPSMIKFGIWAGGDSESEGTREWAGGDTNWDDGPFTMTIQSIKITDGSTNTSSYSYSDQTGDYNSIKDTTGESAAYKHLNHKSTAESLKDKYEGMSTAGKIGVACGVIGALLIAAVAFLVFFFIQRKKGRQQAKSENKEWDEQQNELLEYRNKMSKGQFAVGQTSYGERY